MHSYCLVPVLRQLDLAAQLVNLICTSTISCTNCTIAVEIIFDYTESPA